MLLPIILHPRFTVCVTGIRKPRNPSAGSELSAEMDFKEGGIGETVQKINAGCTNIRD